MYEELETVLDQYVRPQLRGHGGDIRSLSCEDGVDRFRLLGQCSGCPSAWLTTESLIQETLLQAFPDLKQVVLVQQVSDDLMNQARAILRHD